MDTTAETGGGFKIIITFFFFYYLRYDGQYCRIRNKNNLQFKICKIKNFFIYCNIIFYAIL